MIRFFVYSDISSFISNIRIEIQNITNDMSESSKKPSFLYAYSLFESTITEILRYYLNAFPEKTDKNINIGKAELLSSPTTYDIISNSINIYIRKYSSETLVKYLSFFKETLSINLSLDENIINEISQTRNKITHDNSYSELQRMHLHNYRDLPIPSLENIRNYINTLIDTLNEINFQICNTYHKYSYEFLLRSVWSYVFTSPLLTFDQIWTFKNGVLQIKDIKQVKKQINGISSSEHLLLSIFFQQYNNDLNESLHSFRDIPALVSIDKEGKNKIIEIINFFKYYPLIFNGEVIKDNV